MTSALRNTLSYARALPGRFLAHARRDDAVVLAMSGAVFLAANAINFNRRFALDENNYTSIASSFRAILVSLSSLTLPPSGVVDAFFNNGWWGPLLPVMVGLLQFVFSDQVIRALFCISWVVSAYLVFDIGRAIHGRAVGFVSLLLFMLNPYTIFYSFQLTTQALNIFFFLAVLRLLLGMRSDEGAGWQRAVLLGIAAGLGVLSRTQMIPFFFFILLYVAMRTDIAARTRGTFGAVLLATASAIVLPWMLFVYSHSGVFAVTLMNSTAMLSTLDFDSFGSFNSAFDALRSMSQEQGRLYSTIANELLSARLKTLTLSDYVYTLFGNIYEFFNVKNSYMLIESLWVVTRPYFTTGEIIALVSLDGVLRVVTVFSALCWLLFGNAPSRVRLLLAGACGAQVLIVAISNVHGRYFIDLYPFLAIAAGWGLVELWHHRSVATALVSAGLLGLSSLWSYSALAGHKPSSYIANYSAYRARDLDGLFIHQSVSIRDAFDIAVQSECLPASVAFREKDGRPIQLLLRSIPEGAERVEAIMPLAGVAGGISLPAASWFQTVFPVGFIYVGAPASVGWQVGLGSKWIDLPMDADHFMRWRKLDECLLIRWNGYYPALT